MSIGIIITSLFSAVCFGFLVNVWISPVSEKFYKYYHSEKENCDFILKKTNIELSSKILPFFYLVGIILSFLISFFVFPTFLSKTISFIILSFLLRKSGRHLARTLYKRRIDQIKKQLIDALGLVANALRAGLSLLQSLEMAANEMPGAIAFEFKQIISETKLGETIENTLINFKKRIPLKEVATMVDSIIILRETGGNLVETFEILTDTLREEERVQSKIKTLTTQGISQAVVIILLPLFLGYALYTVTPEYIMPLFTHWIGWILIALMVLLQSLGGFIMWKMVKIEI